MMTGSYDEPNWGVIPTEDLKGPSGGIYGLAPGEAKTLLTADLSTRFARSE